MLPELGSFKNIAVVQTAFLGDVALVLPFAQLLKNSIPEANISLITTPAAAMMARCATALQNVIAYDKRGKHSGFSGIRTFAHELERYGFDCVIAPHKSFRTSLLVRLLKPRFSVGFKNAAGSFLYSQKVGYPSHLHEIDRNFTLLKGFKNGEEFLKKGAPEVNVKIAPEDESAIAELLQKKGLYGAEIIIALAPGSVWETKRWRVEHFKSLSEELLKKRLQVILVGSKEDAEMCQEIAGATAAVNLCGETTLPQTLALLRRISAIVSNDSAPTHLAGLVQCPVITIFGPTSPIFGFAPRGKNDRVVQNEELRCRPCEIHGGKRCPIGTHDCMKSVMPQTVVKMVEDVLRKSVRVLP
ncbi:MAG TPA: glycosyltransferase family 9 protein [Patescibacteria group bacterium]|nr:glycosyltransferase family 9 protein [Patescibacteria group bacterium]